MKLLAFFSSEKERLLRNDDTDDIIKQQGQLFATRCLPSGPIY